MFCLEVHSHKTKKGALLNDVAQRHKMRGSFKDPRDLDRHLSVVEEKKTLLTQYASLVNKTIEPFKARCLKSCGHGIARSGYRRLSALSQGFILPVVVQYTPTQFTQMEQFLCVYEQHLTAVLALCKSDRPTSLGMGYQTA